MSLVRKIDHLYFLQNIKCLKSMSWKSYCAGSVFSERFIKIQTCGNIYAKWRDKKLYSKIPLGDLTFKVPYIDTRPTNAEKSDLIHPTVLALHGAPGSWRDFLFLSSCLHNNGCRVIAPSFPDFQTCKPGVFRHSDVEKAQYVKDFLAALSVPNIDFLVVHSGSSFPAILLCLDQKPNIKSLGLLNPVSFTIKGMKSVQPFYFLVNLVKASENPILMKIMEATFPPILKHIYRTPLKCDNFLDPLLSATTMVRGDTAMFKEKYKLVSQKLPIFYAFSGNDPLIPSQLYYDLAELFGANVSDVFIFNEQGHLEQKGNLKPKLKVLNFQKGSHHVYRKYPDLINSNIVNFLKWQKLL